VTRLRNPHNHLLKSRGDSQAQSWKKKRRNMMTMLSSLTRLYMGARLGRKETAQRSEPMAKGSTRKWTQKVSRRSRYTRLRSDLLRRSQTKASRRQSLPHHLIKTKEREISQERKTIMSRARKKSTSSEVRATRRGSSSFDD
jgi:hypothetical protein